MRKYIISGPGPDGVQDIYVCTLDAGKKLADLKSAIKSQYRARAAKPGEGKNLTAKHYSNAVLIFG